MQDWHHLAPPRVCDRQVFIAPPATVTNTQWMTWQRPAGASMLWITAKSGGGGGGGGFTAAASNARGGGGGGGSSGITNVIIPAIFLPDTLYVQVGMGGGGVASGGGTAGSGILSYVSMFQDKTADNVVCVSGAAAPTGGGTGTGGAVGGAGTAGTIAVISAMPVAGAGIFFAIAGQNGAAGGAVAGAVGGAITLPVTGARASGGSGGGGTTSADFAGGLFTAVAETLLSESRPATALAGSNSGSGGSLMETMGNFSFGGSGGASSNAGVGGNGAPGACGGGGGSGGGGGTTGGRGGDGGCGSVIIIAW